MAPTVVEFAFDGMRVLVSLHGNFLLELRLASAFFQLFLIAGHPEEINGYDS
jgi:hypothetical protein